MQKYSRIINMVSGKNKESEEEKKEEDEEEEEPEDEPEEQEEDKHQEHAEHGEHKEHHEHIVTTSEEFIEETEKNVLKPHSPRTEEDERIKQATVPVRGRHSCNL
jgi:NADPH-dependent glutamate synthase beta subunit-like oxidoreductase